MNTLRILVSGIALALGGCAAAPDIATDGRHVPLDGQPNFRDVGGYETADGRTVRRGLVYRSGELPRLSDEDVETLDDLGVRTVVNFLTPQEIEYRGPDRLPPGVELVTEPIDTDDGLAVAIVEARKTGDFSGVPVDLNAEIHRVLTEEAREEYAALYRRIADADSLPLVFHCSHGVHRTGTAAAVLLWSLGVPWETARADYLLSNVYRAEASAERIEQLRLRAAEHFGVAPEDVDTTNIEAFYVLDGSYIDATRDLILEAYGSPGAYLRDGLGLTEAEIGAIRDNLLR